MGWIVGSRSAANGRNSRGRCGGLSEAERELKRQAARLYEKAEAKLDVLLQSSLAASEKPGRPSYKDVSHGNCVEGAHCFTI